MAKVIPEKCNLVIIGAWNPAIIHPLWLKEQFSQLISRDAPVNLELVTGAMSAVRFTINEVQIDPTNGRLLFTPQNANAKTLKFIEDISSGIAAKLAHTPIMAVGFNFFFQLEENEDFLLPFENLTDSYNQLGIPNHDSSQMKHSFALEGNHRLNIFFNREATMKSLHYNFEWPSETRNRIAEITNSFTTHYGKSLELNKKLVRSANAH